MFNIRKDGRKWEVGILGKKKTLERKGKVTKGDTMKEKRKKEGKFGS